MRIWHSEPTLESLDHLVANTLGTYLGIVFTGIGDDWLSGSLPVDHRTIQPARLLHGGASVVLGQLPSRSTEPGTMLSDWR